MNINFVLNTSKRKHQQTYKTQINKRTKKQQNSRTTQQTHMNKKAQTNTNSNYYKITQHKHASTHDTRVHKNVNTLTHNHTYLQ